MILGSDRGGKSFLLNFLITNLQKYDPHTSIFDLGGSFESLTHLFGGSYVRVGLESEDFRSIRSRFHPRRRISISSPSS
jgi:type IV secretion system protein VirB4